MPTIHDVARRAGVSTFTVSAVLNRSAKVSPELTRRVLDAAAALDYTINRIAASLQTRRTMTLGMLIPDIANPFFAKVVRGVEDVCRDAGYSLFLGNTNGSADEQARYLNVFRSRQVDGALLFIEAGSDRNVAALVEKKLAVVLVGRRARGIDADCVTADNRLGARLAVEHLMARGRRRIALIAGNPGVSTTTDRVAGWRDALRRADLSPDPELAPEGDWTAASAQRRMLALLALPDPPDAVFAASFVLLTGVLNALRDRGVRVPGQMELISSDDSEWLDAFDPRISVVQQPSYEMGERAARLLLERIEKPELPPRRIVLKPALKLR